MVGRWRSNAAAPCRAVAAERGRAMSGGGGRTRPRHVERWRPSYVGRWRPNAAALCRAVAAERGRAMSGSGGRTRPRHVGWWRPRAAAPCRVALMGHGTIQSHFARAIYCPRRNTCARKTLLARVNNSPPPPPRPYGEPDVFFKS